MRVPFSDILVALCLTFFSSLSQILHVIEFNSIRMRMSVLVRMPDDRCASCLRQPPRDCWPLFAEPFFATTPSYFASSSSLSLSSFLRVVLYTKGADNSVLPLTVAFSESAADDERAVGAGWSCFFLCSPARLRFNLS
jgi:magnesium-transporting ATPase (P-type)